MVPLVSSALRAPPLPHCTIYPMALGSLPCGHATTQSPALPNRSADAGRRGAQRSEVKEEAKGRGTRTELDAMSACVQKKRRTARPKSQPSPFQPRRANRRFAWLSRRAALIVGRDIEKNKGFLRFLRKNMNEVVILRHACRVFSH